VTDDRTSAAAPEQPTRPALSREHVLRTALALIDADGVDKLTMRRLGTALGVDPMAVYHWVPNKGALLDGVTEVIWAKVDMATLDPTGGVAGIATEAMRRLRDTLRTHPRAVVLVGTHPLQGPTMTALIDGAIGLMADHGIAAPEAIDLLSCLTTFTVGHLLAEVVEPVGGTDDDIDEAGVDPEALAAAFPNLARAMAEGWTWDADRQWEAGVAALIAGWRVGR
jgi:AcrR family transcriptional regulator